MQVRSARPDEAVPIARLAGQLGYPADPEPLRQRLTRLLSDPAHCVMVADDPDGSLLGWIHAAETCPLESGPRGEILGLVVDEGARGTGIGRALVEAVASWAAGRDLPELAVRSNAARVESHHFYARLGFTRIKTQHVYRRPILPGASAP